jgi:ATPase
MRVQDAVQRFLDRVDFGVLPQTIDTIIFVREGEITRVYDIDFSMGIPEGMSGENNIRPLIAIIDHETGEREFQIFKYEGETIVMPLVREGALPVVKVEKEEEKITWKLTEREIQREIGRFTDGYVDVRMQSDNKAVVYIDDKDVPAAIGKGGKNVAGIVNKLSIGIDIRPRSELDRREAEEPVHKPAKEPEKAEGGIRIRIDKKQLSIISPEHSGKIVDVFGGREYLFTATVNESGEIHLAKNSSIAQEMIRRYDEGETIKLRPV